MGDAGTDAELAGLLDQVSVLRGPRTVADLPGGMTNRNVRVTTADLDVVVRLFRGDTELLGIDRDAEHANTCAAAQAGVGAPVVDYRPDLGLLVICHLPGTTYHNASFADPDAVERAGRAIRRLHDGPAFTGAFDMFGRQRRYLDLAHARGCALPAGYPDHAPAFRRVEAALGVHPAPRVPCNNDLLAGNFIDDGERVWLIDYEYSGGNDACFELGNTATECDLSKDQVEALIAAYDGQVTAPRLARVRLQALVSAYGWSLWGTLQASASELDFDYDGWCLERFEKAARGFTADGFDALLDEVARG